MIKKMCETCKDVYDVKGEQDLCSVCGECLIEMSADEMCETLEELFPKDTKTTEAIKEIRELAKKYVSFDAFHSYMMNPKIVNKYKKQLRASEYRRLIQTLAVENNLY